MMNRVRLTWRPAGTDHRASRRTVGIIRLAEPALIRLLAVTCLLMGAGAQTQAQTPSFQGLGQMPGTMAGGGTYTNGISGDGEVVIGHTWTGSSATRPFRWTAAGGFEDLGDLGGNNSSNCRAYGASFDGSVVVGQSSRADGFILAFRWVQGAGMQALPFYEALATSADGSVAVGTNYRWTAPGVLDNLGFLGGNMATYASGVSADGQLVVGYSETSPSRYMHAFRWTPSGGLQDLGVTNGTESLAWGVSRDGAVVFGEARDQNQFWRAFRWTSSLGMRDMGTMGGPMSTSHGASADGSVIVGKSLITSSSGSLRAFRWTASTGMRDLKQELLNAGVTSVQNWTLAVAAGVSDDGTVIAGWGYPASLTPAQPFIAVLPAAGGGGGGGGGVALSSLTLSRSSVKGGDSLSGTARLTAAAPSGGAVLSLSSSDTSVATVPPSVTVSAGSTSKSFTVSTKRVSSNRTVTISGTSGGVTKSASLTVTVGR